MQYLSLQGGSSLSMTLTAVEFVPGHCHLGLWTGVNAKDEMRVSLF